MTKTRKKQNLILQYERGYKKYPESKRETEVLEKTSAEALEDLLELRGKIVWDGDPATWRQGRYD